MELVELLIGIGGWIVATLVVLIRIRNERHHRSELDRLRGLLMRFIEATEKQKKPLNKLVAMGQTGSELREEALAALQIANTAVESVFRAEPQLKSDALAAALERLSSSKTTAASNGKARR